MIKLKMFILARLFNVTCKPFYLISLNDLDLNLKFIWSKVVSELLFKVTRVIYNICLVMLHDYMNITNNRNRNVYLHVAYHVIYYQRSQKRDYHLNRNSVINLHIAGTLSSILIGLFMHA